MESINIKTTKSDYNLLFLKIVMLKLLIYSKNKLQTF